jgi:hypothetical protein
MPTRQGVSPSLTATAKWVDPEVAGHSRQFIYWSTESVALMHNGKLGMPRF